MSAPGSGKTTLLSKLITDMNDKHKIAVVEADIDADVDAAKIESVGATSIQVHTDGMCHMDTGMTRTGLYEAGVLDEESSIDIAFLENVGNLICPAEFATGAHHNMMILSVPEGDDKPLKYPLMFRESKTLVITKADTLSYFTFDVDKCIKRVKELNPDIEIFVVSAKTGEGMSELESHLETLLKNFL
jgi:hydrogenase nickel incorporation protein HypB